MKDATLKCNIGSLVDLPVTVMTFLNDSKYSAGLV